jgi:hypothetical protein
MNRIPSYGYGSQNEETTPLSWLKFGVCVEPLTKPSDCLSESASFY